jgi:hypothetical protein
MRKRRLIKQNVEGVYRTDQDMTKEEIDKIEKEKKEDIAIANAMIMTLEELQDEKERIDEECENAERLREKWEEWEERKKDDYLDDETNIMRALRNGDGDLYGF